MNADKEKTELELRESEGRYAAIFENAAFAIALTKLPEGSLVSVNDAFLKLFEFTREELIGRTSLDLGISDPASRTRVAAELEAHGCVREFEVPRVTKAGELRSLSINVDMTSIGGQPFCITTIQDITDRARAQHGLQVALEARDEFLSIAAHELKTPLTSLRLQLQLLEQHREADTKSTQEARLTRIAGASLRQVDRLTRLVDDMLDVSRVSTGNLSIDPQVTDLGPLIDSVVERLADALASAGCSVRVDLQPGVVARVDGFRIDQVLTNLLTNAMKYAAGKPLEIHLARRGQEAVVVVRDFGGGISREAQPRIFDRFFRAVPHTSVSGFGLGLYIADQIVRLHGGRIEVESDGANGSTFTVSVPLVSGSAGRSDSLVPVARSPVLIVEDDEDIREPLAEFLVRKGYAVHTASNGREALDKLETIDRPGVVLLDLFMPVMDGSQFLNELKSQGVDTVTSLPVVVVSAASAGSALLLAALPLAKAHIQKPFDLGAVLALVKEHCTQS